MKHLRNPEGDTFVFDAVALSNRLGSRRRIAVSHSAIVLDETVPAVAGSFWAKRH